MPRRKKTTISGEIKSLESIHDDDAPLIVQQHQLRKGLLVLDIAFGKRLTELNSKLRHIHETVVSLQKQCQFLKENVAKENVAIFKENEELRKIQEGNSIFEKITQGRNVDDMEEQIQKKDMEIDDLTQQLQKIKLEVSPHKQTQRVNEALFFKRRLEGRLCKTIQDFDTYLTENRKLREEIELFRATRKRNVETREAFQKRMAKAKAEAFNLLDDGNGAYDRRDEYNMKSATLKERMQREQIMHRQEIRDAQVLITHEAKIFKFMSVKNNDRLEERLEECRKRRGNHMEQAMSAEHELITFYEKALRSVKDVTKQDDVKVICKAYQLKDKDNFGLYQHVLNLEDELTDIRREKAELQKRFREVTQEGYKIYHEAHNNMEEMDRNNINVSNKLDRMQNIMQSNDRTLDEVKRIISDIFRKTGCSKSALLENLLVGSELRNNTLAEYVRLLEEHCQDMLDILEFIEMQKEQSGEDNADRFKVNIGEKLFQRRESDLYEVKIQCPPTDKESSWSDTDDEQYHTFDRAELTRRAVQRIEKRNAEGQAKAGMHEHANNHQTHHQYAKDHHKEHSKK